MSLTSFKIIIRGISISFILIMAALFVLFCYDLYGRIYLSNQSLFSTLYSLSKDTYSKSVAMNELMHFLTENAEHIIQIFKDAFFICVIPFVIKIFIISMLYYVFNRLPIPNALIGYWEKRGDINNILGRNLTDYLRYHRFFTIRQFMHCSYSSEMEAYLLYKHSNNKHLKELFKNHDPYIEQDSK